MNIKRILFSSAIVFLFIFFYEWGFHGILMNDMYANTSELWRSEADMQAKFMWLVFGQLIFAFMLTFIFSQAYQNRGVAEGLRFGIYFSVLLGAPYFVMYAVAPYTLTMVFSWIAGLVVEMLGVGVILSLLFKKCASHNEPAWRM